MITINEEKCIGCGLCVKDCFPDEIEIIDRKAKPKGLRCMECGHCIAVCPTNAVTLVDYPMSDIMEYKKGEFEVEADQYLRSLKYRRTIRQFSNKQVEKEKIEKIIEAGRYSSTGGNRQNVSYCVLRDDLETLKVMALEELNRMGNLPQDVKEKMGLIGYDALWRKMYDDYHSEDQTDNLFFDTETVILVISPSAQNASIAAAHMETMVYAQELGMVYSGFFTIAASQSKEIKEYLKLNPGQEVVACLVVGYPKVKYERTVPRKEAQIVWR